MRRNRIQMQMKFRRLFTPAFFGRHGVKLILIGIVVYCLFFLINSIKEFYNEPKLHNANPAIQVLNYFSTGQQEDASVQKTITSAFTSGVVIATSFQPATQPPTQPFVQPPSGTIENANAKQTETPQHINPHPFNYVILETDICKLENNTSPLVIIIVHTHPLHLKSRMAIRRTWGASGNFGPALDSGIVTRLLFTMGFVPNDPTLMDRVKKESQQYRDILQEDFLDAYKNLTYKAVMWMKWVSVYCTEAFYVLKTDDDVFVNRFNVLKLVRNLYDHKIWTNSIVCRVWRNLEVHRDNRSKWYVSPDEYPDNVYCDYCSGPAYMMSSDLPKLLYEKSLETRFFWVDDVYVTGVLTAKLEQVTYHDVLSKFLLVEADFKEVKNVYDDGLFIHMGTDGKVAQYRWWSNLLKARGILARRVDANTIMMRGFRRVVPLASFLVPNITNLV